MSSGSKKRPRAKPRARSTRAKRSLPVPRLGETVPELAAWQVAVLDAVAASGLARFAVFGGGAALACRHLHHRRSEDVDFFLPRELEPGELQPVTRTLVRDGFELDEQQVGPRHSLVLSRDGTDVGRIDFAFYPYDPIGRRETWRGLVVESLLDMTVNKLQALLTRFQTRDFVDMYFLLREGPEPDIDRLLGLVRAKFDVGADRLALAQRLLLVGEARELPAMLRPLTMAELVSDFEERARGIVRRG